MWRSRNSTYGVLRLPCSFRVHINTFGVPFFEILAILVERRIQLFHINSRSTDIGREEDEWREGSGQDGRVVVDQVQHVQPRGNVRETPTGAQDPISHSVKGVLALSAHR